MYKKAYRTSKTISKQSHVQNDNTCSKNKIGAIKT